MFLNSFFSAFLLWEHNSWRVFCPSFNNSSISVFLGRGGDFWERKTRKGTWWLWFWGGR